MYQTSLSLSLSQSINTVCPKQAICKKPNDKKGLKVGRRLCEQEEEKKKKKNSVFRNLSFP